MALKMRFGWKRMVHAVLLFLLFSVIVNILLRESPLHSKRSLTVWRSVSTVVSKKTVACAGRTQEKSPRGFVLASRYWEQQTQAMRVLLQLQCFATNHGLRMVEPFLYGSHLGIPFSTIRSGGVPLRFGDLMDLSLWNAESVEKFGLYPVATWPEFLNVAPRNVISVCIRYRDSTHLPVPVVGSDFRQGCSPKCFQALNNSLMVLQKYGDFKIVKEVCANFVRFAGAVEEHIFFKRIIFGHDGEKVTVFVNEFRGFFGLYRMPVLSKCGIDFHNVNMTVSPSREIMNDAKRYISNVLNSEPFVAILVRVERVVLHLQQNVTDCINELRMLLSKVSVSCNTRRYFLAMDVGRFGSSGTANDPRYQIYGQTILSSLYGNSTNLTNWEATFEKHTSNVEAAYVANLQRAIAARAKCLVMFGGGSFQTQASIFFRQQHQTGEDQNIYKVCFKYSNAALSLMYQR